jgi:hypothetical protein
MTGGVIAVGALLGLQEAAQATVAVPSACDAIAMNLVQNCGFETGDLTDWTPGAVAPTVGSSNPHTGDFAAVFANATEIQTISQSIPTSANSVYDVTFWLANDNFQNNFDATFGTTSLASFNNMLPFGYTSFSTTVEATSSTTALVFNGQGSTDTFFLDDISVVQAAVATPEPTSLALIGSALLTFAAVRRFRPRSTGSTTTSPT